MNDPCATVTVTPPAFATTVYTPEKTGFTKDFDVDFTRNFSQDSTPNCPFILTANAASLTAYTTFSAA